jgi:hypothetical protein
MLDCLSLGYATYIYDHSTLAHHDRGGVHPTTILCDKIPSVRPCPVVGAAEPMAKMFHGGSVAAGRVLVYLATPNFRVRPAQYCEGIQLSSVH